MSFGESETQFGFIFFLIWHRFVFFSCSLKRSSLKREGIPSEDHLGHPAHAVSLAIPGVGTQMWLEDHADRGVSSLGFQAEYCAVQAIVPLAALDGRR